MWFAICPAGLHIHSRKETNFVCTSIRSLKIDLLKRFLCNCQYIQSVVLIYSLFQNIQSTNWQSMRFKPPPPGSPIGWRVEFRVLEAQLTDFENAAFVVFIVLLTRVILTYKLDLLMPISRVSQLLPLVQRKLPP